MPKLVPIVEGPGEVSALPILLKKILGAMNCYDIQIAPPKNANGRESLTKAGGLEKFLTYAASERDCGVILILLDVENGCPLDLVRDFVMRISAHYVPFPVVIVAANKMYENWILASLETVRGRKLDDREGLPADASLPADAEAENGKRYIENCFPLIDGYRRRGYKETLDQKDMTEWIDITLAKSNSRSFRRLCHAIEEAVNLINAPKKAITPTLVSVEAALSGEKMTESKPSRKGKKKP